jgi:sugar lactone lactonase YvrE
MGCRLSHGNGGGRLNLQPKERMERLLFRSKLRWGVILIVAMIALGLLGMMFSRHPHVADVKQLLLDVEQLLLAPWLAPAYLGDGKPAAELLLCFPMGLALNQAGEVLISDRGRDRRGRVVWRIDSHGIAHILAGTGLRGKATETTARRLSFSRPEGLAVGADGSVFVSDAFNHAVYRIHTDGSVTRVAGTGLPGYAGDGGPASEAMLNRPADIRLDRKGNLFIADVRNHSVRKVDVSGRITTVAGTGEPGFSADGTPAAKAKLNTPWGLAVDHEDLLIIADSENHRIRRVQADGRLVTLAGNGREGFNGDGGLAIEASLSAPQALSFDPSGRLFIGDEHNNAVRVLGTDGRISTVMGTGAPGRGVIGDRAQGSALNDPENVLTTPAGDLIITDGENGRVLRISDDGRIHKLAGRGETRRCAPRW